MTAPQGGLEAGARSQHVPRPVFIIGAPRSGTSIMTWALGQHPNIQPMPETAWLSSMAVGAFLSHRKGSERGRFSHLSNVGYPDSAFMRRIGESMDAIVGDVYRERCRKLYGERSLASPGWTLNEKQMRNPLQVRRHGDDPKRRWIDGTPLNSFYVWAIAQLFPEARFIHSLRQPDDVATSLERFDNVGAEPQALEDGLRTWIAHTENAWYAERGLGADKVFRLDFKRIARDPEELLRALCEFLGEPWSADCLIPLSRKINSSGVEAVRERNRDALRENEVFQTAQAVYDAAVRQPVEETPDEAAWGIVHQRFLDYCKDRALV